MFKNSIVQKSKAGFTLAEVLITLGIIGVVAALTIPTLVADYNQKSLDTAASVFNRKLGEAIKLMNTNQTLSGLPNTAKFVEELGKHIKIVNTCDSNHLTNCFASEVAISGDDPIEVQKLKDSKNLYSVQDWGTETIGVQFADGTSALIAYNKTKTYDPYSNQVVELAKDREGKNVSLHTDAISILYDVNGLKTPNQFGTGKDMRGINISLSEGFTILNLNTAYSFANCSSSSSSDWQYCGNTPSGSSNDAWAGAKKACAQQGLKLPTKEELTDLRNKGVEGLPTTGYYWTANEKNASTAYDFGFSSGTAMEYSKTIKDSALCISK